MRGLPVAVAVGPGIGVRGRGAVASRVRRRLSAAQEPSARRANLPWSEIRPLETVVTSVWSERNFLALIRKRLTIGPRYAGKSGTFRFGRLGDRIGSFPIVTLMP